MNPTEEEQRQSFISTESNGNSSRRRVSFRLRQFKYRTYIFLICLSDEGSKEEKQKRRHSNYSKREIKGEQILDEPQSIFPIK